MAKYSRRAFIERSAQTAGAIALASLTHQKVAAADAAPNIIKHRGGKRVLVLGIDGMDPILARQMMREGDLPNFSKLASLGHFGELQTTMPPQSPVAWSSFITGTNPGGHGIYDFIHRDPQSFQPYLSTSRSYDAKRAWELGNWKIPLESGRVELKRKGTAFWDVLAAQGIPSTIYALPANFPVEDSGPLVQGLSGMGTPDLLGGYGRYTLFCETPPPGAEKFSSGQMVKVSPVSHVVKTELRGPSNPFKKIASSIETPLTLTRDPERDIVKIEIEGQTILLAKGEWSDWIALNFSFVPLLASAQGMVRFYVKKVHPELEIYASPVNIDPASPALPICSPQQYAPELTEALGRFYTQGLPADTKALSEGSLSSAEFWSQAQLVLAESQRALDFELSRFQDGCLVFYFSSIDQCSHMLMRCMDPSHPLFEPNASAEVKQAIKFLYKAMDHALGRALEKVDARTTFFALSDHGFTSFTREFHLSTWLYEQGFLKVTRPERVHDMEFYRFVNWGDTQAYALGINGIYINRKGREKNGSVSESAVQGIKEQIAKQLLQVTDPKTGKRVVREVYDSEKLYSGPFTSLAPDLLVGYAPGYRISDEAILGKFPQGIVGDRTDPWASDHCMDPSAVPGVFLCNHKIQNQPVAIWDLAPSILKVFGVPQPESMTGKAVLDV